MSPGKVCKNLGMQGCTIYNERPEDPCRNFNCLWRSAEFLSDELRPDRSGAIVVATKLLDWPVVQVVPTHTEKVPERALHQAMLLAAGAGVPIIEVCREEENGEIVMTQTVYGPPAFVEAMAASELPTSLSLMSAFEAQDQAALHIIHQNRSLVTPQNPD